MFKTTNNLLALIALAQVQTTLALQLEYETQSNYGGNENCCTLYGKTDFRGNRQEFCFDSSSTGQEAWSLDESFRFKHNDTTYVQNGSVMCGTKAELHLCPSDYETEVIDEKDWHSCPDGPSIKVGASLKIDDIPFSGEGTLIVQYHPWLTKGPAYLNLDRKHKQDIIYNKILEDDTIGPLNTIGFAQLDLNTVFDDEGDELNCRYKTTHGQGSVGKVEWVDYGDHPYTGMFKGGDTGFIRLSDLSAANPGNPTDMPWMWPSLAVKLLRDGKDSANAFANIDSNLGQMSYNFFEQSYYSIVTVSNDSGAPSNIFLKHLIVQQVTNFTGATGHSEFARFDQYGNEELNPEFPFGLQYTASPDLSMPSQTYDETYFEYAKRIPVDSVLYVVSAQATPDSEFVDIGELRSRSQLTTSLWGDKKMHFKHTRFDDDLMDHPEWIDGGNPFTPFGNYPTPETLRPQVGMNEQVCPFAWLLDALPTY